MKIIERLKKYKFEIRHLIVLFIILLLFQIILSFVHTTSTQNLLSKTLELYKQDTVEKMANLTATSMEIVFDLSMADRQQTTEGKRQIIEAFNIILSQQTLQQNIDEIAILLPTADKILSFDDGKKLYAFIFDGVEPEQSDRVKHSTALNLFAGLKDEIIRDEQIYTMFAEDKSFRVLVPFVPKGEVMGAVYMKITPDVSKISGEITSATDEAGVIFSALILFGLLAMFYITSHTVKERDEAQRLLFTEKEKRLRRQIDRQKEALFTKRIYHAHHKAEKIMGFIKEDIKRLNDHNLNDYKGRILKYSNFISRVIYDMKSYDPPIHVIRNPIFQTDLNEVVRFMIEQVFSRVHNENGASDFNLELDENLPLVHVNEYVTWEILEPLIQNSLDHNPEKRVRVTIRSRFFTDRNLLIIEIEDNGKGIPADLLEFDDEDVQNVFRENTSTKFDSENSGYGCYIAYEICKRRCGWDLFAENLQNEGCKFTITIPA